MYAYNDNAVKWGDMCIPLYVGECYVRIRRRFQVAVKYNYCY